jgi:polyisoprenoid-binding protein YceI
MCTAFKQSSIAALLICTALATLAAGTNVDIARSSVIATFKQENVPVDAAFRRFSGTIVYDAKNVAAASAALEVETGSLDMGDEAYNDELRKKSWFDSTAYPKANFRSTAIKAGTAGQFAATGTLTIKGKAATLTVPVNVSSAGTSNVFDGTLIISRKAFGIGAPVWDEVLDDKVSVRFHLVVPR